MKIYLILYETEMLKMNFLDQRTFFNEKGKRFFLSDAIR